MPILIAAVAVVGALCVLDLLLTFGIVRRLREHTSMLGGARGLTPPVVGLSAGESPAAFSAVTIGGVPVSAAAAPRVVAFFSSSCSICPERVPPFAEYLSSHCIERDIVLAVIEGSQSEPPPYLDRLAKVAQVCVEQPGGEIARAFRVRGFPAFCLLDSDGAVVASGHDPSVLAEPAAV